MACVCLGIRAPAWHVANAAAPWAPHSATLSLPSRPAPPHSTSRRRSLACRGSGNTGSQNDGKGNTGSSVSCFPACACLRCAALGYSDASCAWWAWLVACLRATASLSAGASVPLARPPRRCTHHWLPTPRLRRMSARATSATRTSARWVGWDAARQLPGLPVLCTQMRTSSGRALALVHQPLTHYGA